MRIFHCVLTVLLLCSSAVGREIIVDNAGGDDRFTGQQPRDPGGVGGPVRTLAKALQVAGRGDTIILVKNGVLAKAVCKGAQVAIDLNGSMAPVAVVTTLNTQKYCTSFGGATVVKDGSDDKTFLHKSAPAPGGCPGPGRGRSGGRSGGAPRPHRRREQRDDALPDGEH